MRVPVLVSMYVESCRKPPNIIQGGHDNVLEILPFSSKKGVKGVKGVKGCRNQEINGSEWVSLLTNDNSHPEAKVS